MTESSISCLRKCLVLVLLLKLACCTQLPAHCKWKTNTRLICNNAGLTKLPDGIPVSTEYLDFSNNPSLNFEDDYFLRFKNLQVLFLVNCSRSRPVLFPSSLKELYLNKNSLKTTSVITMFKHQSSNLTHINLSDNKLLLNHFIQLLPKASLERLKLEGNTMPAVQQDDFRGFIKLRELNLGSCWIEKICQHAFDSLRFLWKIRLSGNCLKTLPRGLFRFLKRLNFLYLETNKFDRPPDVRGPLRLQKLALSRNQIETISRNDFFGQTITSLVFDYNNIHSFDFRYTKYLDINLSFNNITKLNDFAFRGRKGLMQISLQNNILDSISPLAFKGISQIGTLYLQRNSIRALPSSVFQDLIITNLFLFGNQIESMSGVLTNMKSPPKLLLLFTNPQLQEFKRKDYQTMVNQSSVYISCDTLNQFSGYGELSADIRCFPSMTFSITTADADLEKSGFNCISYHGNAPYKCTPCALGHYILPGQGGCKSCPAGSFYQDELASTYCKHCPAGQYVPPNKSPGKSPLECLTCPDGTKKNKTAGYRACSCLDGFARRDRFGQCNKCSHEGISCEIHDYPVLQKGYWWVWHSETSSSMSCRNSFVAFMKNLDTEDDTYDRNTVDFRCSLPQPHRCPIKGSCLGGVNATCATGYTGILCSVCEPGYSRQFQKCVKCPKTFVAVLQFLGYLVLFLVICAVVSWRCEDDTDTVRSEDDNHRRTYADIILSNLKILLGFYQVLVACLNAFSFVNWPNSLKQTIGFFKFIQFEVIRIPSLRCIKPEWHLNAVDEFWIAIVGTAILPILIFIYFVIKKIYLHCKVNSPSEFARQTLLCKKNCLRVLVLFLFVTYPSTSQRIINVLPLSCNNICANVKNGQCLHPLSYMRADYSVKCLSFSAHNHLTLLFAYIAILIPLGLPMILFFLLWKFAPREQQEEHHDLTINQNEERIEIDNEGHESCAENDVSFTDNSNQTNESSLQFALKFLYENYKTENRYWESLEMFRKLIMTAGITLFIGFGYYKIVMGMTIAIAGFFAILHAYRHPIRNDFENGVQLASLSIVSLNVCFGLILQSSWYKEYEQKNGDNLAVGVLFVLLNLVVLMLILYRLIPIFYKALKALCKRFIGCFRFRCRSSTDELNNLSTPLVRAQDEISQSFR